MLTMLAHTLAHTLVYSIISIPEPSQVIQVIQAASQFCSPRPFAGGTGRCARWDPGLAADLTGPDGAFVEVGIPWAPWPCWGHAGAMLGPCWGHVGLG